jgi:PAS domain S-box-containing protein
LDRALREGRFDCDGWRVRKDGTRFWAYVVIDPIRQPKGEIIGYAKITRDLTERRAAEEELRRGQEQFRLLVQGVTDYAICMLDTKGLVSSWNLGAQRIKGYAPGEIIGQHFSRFYTDEDRAAGAPQEALETARRDGRFEKEGQRVRKDGTRFWAHVIIDAITNDAGEPIGFAKITRDITERRQAQEKLEKTREALLQSQKMEAVGQLTGGIAHDFNNLLMAVLGSLELVRKRLPDDGRTRSLLENAVEGARRGVSLTKRMLAFARRQELKQERIDVADLVRGMAELMQRSLGPGIEIETRFPLAALPVIADANQLEMALLNLAVNARDAMPEGGQIIISAREESIFSANGLRPGQYIALTITDRGTGMDQATLARAMEPFFTTKGLGRGTGLGLSMVHGFAEQSGGRFTLCSQQGEGTTAEIWLPMAEDVVRPAVGQPKDEEMHADRGSLVVLAVDDDPLVLLNTVAMLEDFGHEVFSASSGQKALDILRGEDRVDVVITDQAMPQMTGVQLADAIAKDWPDLPVILATGYAEIREGTAAGLRKLNKPFTQGELAIALADVPRKKGTVVRFPANGCGKA